MATPEEPVKRRIAPRPPGMRPIGFCRAPKDLADMTDAEIHRFAGALVAEVRRALTRKGEGDDVTPPPSSAR